MHHYEISTQPFSSSDSAMSLDDGSPAPPPYSSVAHTPRQSLNPTAPVFLPPYDQLGRNGRNPSSDVSASQGALGELHDRHERRARRWNIGLDPGRAGIVDPYPYPFPENHHHSQGIRTAIAVDLPSIIITLLIIFAVLLSILPLHSFEGSSEYEATFNGKSVRVIEKWSVEWSTSRGPSRTRVRTVSGVVDLWIPKRERQVHVSAPFSAQIE